MLTKHLLKKLIPSPYHWSSHLEKSIYQLKPVGVFVVKMSETGLEAGINIFFFSKRTEK